MICAVCRKQEGLIAELRARLEAQAEVIAKCHEAVGEDSGSDDSTLPEGIELRLKDLRNALAWAESAAKESHEICLSWMDKCNKLEDELKAASGIVKTVLEWNNTEMPRYEIPDPENEAAWKRYQNGLLVEEKMLEAVEEYTKWLETVEVKK